MLGDKHQLLPYICRNRQIPFKNKAATTVNYWARIKNLPTDDVLHKCLKIQENLHNAGQNNWYSKIENILTTVDVIDWRNKEPSKVVKDVKLELYSQEQNRILNEINDSNKHPKLRTYKIFKTSYCLEPYLNMNLSKKTYPVKM